MNRRQRVIVLGSSRGIGKACASLLSEQGNDVTGIARTLADGVGYRQVILDLTQKDVQEAFTELCREFDPDSLVFSVGQNHKDDLSTLSLLATREVIEVNAISALLTVSAFVREASAPRSIVLISSVHARGNGGRLSYSVSKAALEALMKSSYRELMRKGVRINCVRPGPTETDMLKCFFPVGSTERDSYLKEIPSRRFSSVGEIAGLICFLVSDDSRNITGQTISVSGGF